MDVVKTLSKKKNSESLVFETVLSETVFRVFLNLWFAKPMACVRFAFHENDGNHKNDENNQHNSDK